MGRLSTRTQYRDPDIYGDPSFTSQIKDRDLKIFMDWIGGMTGKELSKKWSLADITVRHNIGATKIIYDDIKRRKKHYG